MEKSTAVRDLIDGMTQEERDDLLSYMEYQRSHNTGGKQAKTRALTHDQQKVLDAVHEVLRIPRERRQPSISIVKALGGWAKFDFVVEHVHCFVDASCRPGTELVVRMHVMRAAFMCLVDYMRNRKAWDADEGRMRANPIPTTPSTVLTSTPSLLAYAVELQFPGYPAARLLDRIAPLVALQYNWTIDDEEGQHSRRRRRVLQTQEQNVA